MSSQSSYFLILSLTFRAPTAVIQEYSTKCHGKTGQKLPKDNKKLRNAGQKARISLLSEK